MSHSRVEPARSRAGRRGDSVPVPVRPVVFFLETRRPRRVPSAVATRVPTRRRWGRRRRMVTSGATTQRLHLSPHGSTLRYFPRPNEGRVGFMPTILRLGSLSVGPPQCGDPKNRGIEAAPPVLFPPHCGPGCRQPACGQKVASALHRRLPRCHRRKRRRITLRAAQSDW